jgi:tetratricopeptide (TPR) repeat protein
MKLFISIVCSCFLFLIFSVIGCKETTTVSQGRIDSLAKIHPDLARLSVAINKTPKQANLYFARGNVFSEVEMLDEAAKDLFTAIQLDSTNINYYLTFADINVKARYLKIAINYLNKAAKISPTNIEVHVKLSKLYLYLKEYETAMKEANLVIGLDNSDERSYLLQGIIYKEKGDTAQAMKTFQIVVANNPDSYDGYMQLGLLGEIKKDPKALYYFLNTVRIDSNRYEGQYALAMYYQNHQQIRNAIALYRQMVMKNSQEPQPIYNLGYLYFKIDSLKKAYDHFTLVIQTDPLNADAYYMRGLCNVKRKIWNEAISDFTQTLKLKDDYEEARIELKKLQGK